MEDAETQLELWTHLGSTAQTLASALRPIEGKGAPAAGEMQRTHASAGAFRGRQEATPSAKGDGKKTSEIMRPRKPFHDGAVCDVTDKATSPATAPNSLRDEPVRDRSYHTVHTDDGSFHHE